MVERGSHPLTEILALVAPGTPFRDGLDRVLQAKRGALVVVGDDAGVLSICTGGFLLDAEFSPQRLSELAKMDGAIILASDASRIARANVHLVPRASIPTSETGTRHRTAERVARSLDVPVITVSGSMSTISVYRNDRRHIVQRTHRLVDRAGQALSTLQRFKNRFDLAIAALSTLEVEDTVSVRDVVAVVQPGEMIVRIAGEIEGYLVELGEDGRLIHLQLQELAAGAEKALRLVLGDYVVARETADGPGEGKVPSREERERLIDRAAGAFHRLTADELADPVMVAGTLGLGGALGGLDVEVEPRGYRLLHRLPRISDVIIDRIVERFTDLPGILQASLGDLEKVGGVGGAKARAVKDGLARIVEASILERYD
ncbi:MAG TPA: DNA integrity scanning diadenylate cyclase DisA [Acidimicrobiales bacterium]|nr:DNA integrity scanning diadenylate cyclase DisA [Acidimicrobiales bacterium]